jgi:hypothetical protein
MTGEMAATEPAPGSGEGVPPFFGGKRLNALMYHVYIIENQQGRHYIGVSACLEERIKKHNCHGTRWTKYKGPRIYQAIGPA